MAAPVNGQYNSTLLARSNQFEFLEGQLDCNRVVINRFDTIDAAKAFYHSVEYQAAKSKRSGLQHAGGAGRGLTLVIALSGAPGAILVDACRSNAGCRRVAALTLMHQCCTQKIG